MAIEGKKCTDFDRGSDGFCIYYNGNKTSIAGCQSYCELVPAVQESAQDRQARKVNADGKVGL